MTNVHVHCMPRYYSCVIYLANNVYHLCSSTCPTLSLPFFSLFSLSLPPPPPPPSLSLSLLAPCWSKEDSHELQLFTDDHLSSTDLPDSEKAKRVSVLSVQFLSSSYLYLHYSPPFHSTIDRCQSASLTPLKRACKKVMWIHLMRTSLTHHRAW